MEQEHLELVYNFFNTGTQFSSTISFTSLIFQRILTKSHYNICKWVLLIKLNYSKPYTAFATTVYGIFAWKHKILDILFDNFIYC